MSLKDITQNGRPVLRVLEDWSGSGILIGPYLRFPLTEQLSWDLRGLFGFYGSCTPRVTVRSTLIKDESGKGEYYRVSGNDFNYCYSFGTGIKYQFKKNYMLVFGDYLFFPQQFSNRDGDSYTTSGKQNISNAYITAGSGYFL